MTRRGSPEERRWRRWRNMETGSDGSIHGEQPVDPRGRHPREKPSGHRHTEPQPPDDHGPSHDADGSDANPHTTTTTNPHSVTHSQVGAPTGNPHGVTAEEAEAVRNSVGSPARRRENRADQPAASNVAVGTESRIKDEAEVLEVAADTTGDGNADTWIVASTDPTHDHDSRYVNEAGDTMTGTLTMEPGNDVGWVLHDANATEVARADTPGADHGRFTARERDGTLAGSRVEMRNSSHATPTQTDVVGDPVKVVGPLETDHGFVPTQFVTANESRTRNKRNSDFDADGTDDHLTIQNAIDALPVGTK